MAGLTKRRPRLPGRDEGPPTSGPPTGPPTADNSTTDDGAARRYRPAVVSEPAADPAAAAQSAAAEAAALREATMNDWDQAYSSRWWVTGFPCAALVLAYGGTPAVLCASMGTLLWHMLDMAGDAMKGQSLLVWWLNLLAVAVTIGIASNTALTHSNWLVVVPLTQYLWLLLLGVWGTITCRWVREDAPLLVDALGQLLETFTPLIAPALLTWGSLATQLVNPSYMAFVYFLLATLTFSLHASPVRGFQRVRSTDQRLLAALLVITPPLLHITVHGQLLRSSSPAYGTSSGSFPMGRGPLPSLNSAMSALKEAVGDTGDGTDDPRTGAVWELVLLLCLSVLALFLLETRCSGPSGLGIRMAIQRLFFSKSPSSSSSATPTVSEAPIGSRNKSTGSGSGDTSRGAAKGGGSEGKAGMQVTWDSRCETVLGALAFVAACVAVLALEKRILFRAFRHHFVIAPPLDGYMLTAALWSGLAGLGVRLAGLGGDEVSAGAMQGGAAVAALICASLVGIPMLLRPCAIAAALALCEFLFSSEIIWFLVAAVASSVALWWWANHSLGFLSDTLALPHFAWLPWLGGSTLYRDGAPLHRLLLALVALAGGAFLLPALVLSDKPPFVVALALTVHCVFLACVEAVIAALPVSDGVIPYPTYLMCLTGFIHTAAAVKLNRIRASSFWAVPFNASVLIAKVLTLGHENDSLSSHVGSMGLSLGTSAFPRLVFLLFSSVLPFLETARFASKGAGSGNKGAGDTPKGLKGKGDSGMSWQVGLGLVGIMVVAIKASQEQVLRPLLAGIIAAGPGAGSTTTESFTDHRGFQDPDGMMGFDDDIFAESGVGGTGSDLGNDGGKPAGNKGADLRLTAVEWAMLGMFALTLVARHFPHKRRLRRFISLQVVTALLVTAVAPIIYQAAAVSANLSLQERARVMVFDGAEALGLPAEAAWCLVGAASILTSAAFGVIPMGRLGGGGTLFMGLLLGGLVGVYVAGATLPVVPPIVTLLWAVQWAFLGAVVLLSGTLAASVNKSRSTRCCSVSMTLGGPLYLASLTAAVAAYAVQELAIPPEYIPQGMAAAASFYSVTRIGLAFHTALGQAAAAVAIRLHAISDGADPLSMVAGAGSNSLRPITKSNFGGPRDATFEEPEWAVFAGNGATMTGYMVANVYASMRLRYLQTGSLRGMAVSLPLCLLLTLLQDDGAFLYGLDEKSRYAPPLFAFLLRLLSSALHAVVMPGNPFFGGDPVTLQKAYAAAQTSPQTAAAAALGLDLEASRKLRALHRLSFWTAESWSTPALELVLILGVLPTYIFVLQYLWRRHRMALPKILVFLPLNVVALAMGAQTSTRVLGFCGGLLAAWQIFSLQRLRQSSQSRL